MLSTIKYNLDVIIPAIIFALALFVFIFAICGGFAPNEKARIKAVEQANTRRPVEVIQVVNEGDGVGTAYFYYLNDSDTRCVAKKYIFFKENGTLIAKEVVE